MDAEAREDGLKRFLCCKATVKESIRYRVEEGLLVLSTHPDVAERPLENDKERVEGDSQNVRENRVHDVLL
jgi:hypothetical protein